MNLAIVSNMRGCPWAGSETVWHLVAMEALNEGHTVTAFLHPDLISAPQIQKFLEAGGKLRTWHAWPIARFEKIQETIMPNFPSRTMRRYDCILVSLGSLPAINYVPGLATYLSQTTTPFVLFCQFNSDHLIMSSRERESVAEVIKNSHSVTFVCERNLQEARRQFAIEPPSSKVILNTVSVTPVNEISWPDKSIPIAFASVARLEVAWKGQDLLLEVLSQPRWREREWSLNIYGRGPDHDHIRQLANFFNISERVTFHGFINNLSDIWVRNHLLVLPSRGEGTPLAALEAMSYGRPVLATDVGGISEIIQDGNTGFIARAATVSSFSEALERAWSERFRWADMGACAKKGITESEIRNPAKALLLVCKEVSH